MKYWEVIADNLSKARWSWGCVATVDSSGRTIWIADAHRDNEKRFVAHADEKLTAFLELESANRHEEEPYTTERLQWRNWQRRSIMLRFGAIRIPNYRRSIATRLECETDD